MSGYGLSQSAVAPLSVSQISQIDLSAYTGYSMDKKLPNRKISFDVHTAYGGYVIRVSRGAGVEDDMYVISEDKDLGAELGKIITHTNLKADNNVSPITY